MVQFSIGEQLSGTPYRVVEAVGSGGMGSVFEVEHAELGKRFVLKVLHHHLASRSDLVGRMRNEWRALAKLNHPNIVQVTDAGQLTSGLPFYVMEKLEGRNLGQWIAQQGRLSPSQAGAIMSDVLDALHAAHSTGAIHRDVKPQNIFVLESGRAKLLDFGIAKLKDRAARVVTAGGVSIGTPRYMAPEQAEGKSVDGRADIYAAALVLYEAIAGKGPFSHIRDPNELVLAHIGMDPIRLDEVTHGVSPEWADLVQRWLSKRPGDRPGSAGIAASELRALLKATTSTESAAEREVTLGGVYDAETVGAQSSDLSEAGERPHPADMMHDRGLPDELAHPQHRPNFSRPAQGTLGWGTATDDLTGTQTLRPDTQPVVPSRPTPSPRPVSVRSASLHPSLHERGRHSTGSGRESWGPPSGTWGGAASRPQTPPPVSSTPRPSLTWWDRLRPVQKNVVTVVGAAVGSFTVAWLGVHTYTNIQSDLAAHSSPMGSSPSAESNPRTSSDSAPGSPAMVHPPVTAQRPEMEVPATQVRGSAEDPSTLSPKSSAALAHSVVPPSPSAQPAPQLSSAAAPKLAVSSQSASAPASAGPQPAAGRSPQTTTSMSGATPAASPSKATASPSSKSQLPGSGLW